MGKIGETNQTVEKREAHEDTHEASRRVEDLLEEMVNESEKEVAQLHAEAQEALARDELREKENGLKIKPEYKKEMQDVNEEVEKAKEEFKSEIFPNVKRKMARLVTGIGIVAVTAGSAEGKISNGVEEKIFDKANNSVLTNVENKIVKKQNGMKEIKSLQEIENDRIYAEKIAELRESLLYSGHEVSVITWVNRDGKREIVDSDGLDGRVEIPKSEIVEALKKSEGRIEKIHTHNVSIGEKNDSFKNFSVQDKIAFHEKNYKQYYEQDVLPPSSEDLIWGIMPLLEELGEDAKRIDFNVIDQTGTWTYTYDINNPFIKGNIEFVKYIKYVNSITDPEIIKKELNLNEEELNLLLRANDQIVHGQKVDDMNKVAKIYSEKTEEKRRLFISGEDDKKFAKNFTGSLRGLDTILVNAKPKVEDDIRMAFDDNQLEEYGDNIELFERLTGNEYADRELAIDMFIGKAKELGINISYRKHQ